MSLCSWCAVSQTVPSASFWKNLTTSFESVLAKVPDSVSYWIDLLFLARSSYQVLSLLILALEGKVCENDIRFLPAAVLPSIFKALTHFRVDSSLTGELLASACLRWKHKSKKERLYSSINSGRKGSQELSSNTPPMLFPHIVKLL